MPEIQTPEGPATPEPPPKIDPFKNSPLGQDPTTPKEPVPAPTPTSQPEPEVDSGITIAREDYDALVEKGKNYDIVASDDKAMAILRQHYMQENLNNPDPVTPKDETDYGRQITELKELVGTLSEQIGSSQEQMATIAISEFSKAHPDFEKHRVGIGKIMGDHPGMTLERALTLAKAEAGPTEPAPSGERTDVATRPAVETEGSSDIPGAGNSLQEAERRLTDTKEVPDFEDACKMALDAALEHHGVKR